MALRGRRGIWQRPAYQAYQPGQATSDALRAIISAQSAAQGTTTPTTGGTTGAMSETARIAEQYDLPSGAIDLILDPSMTNDANKAAAAGGSDPKTARYPVLLRKPGDRLPTAFELQNQWAYQADREPIVGEGGKTLDANDPNSWDEFTRDGYIPPRGSAAFKAMEANYSSVGETIDQTLQRLELRGSLGQPLQEYPTGLKPLQNKEAIPFSSAVVYYPPAYKTVQNPDGTTTTEYLSTGWSGQPAGYSVDPTVATSANNFPALQGNMVPDDPNFKPTPNPTFWILPNGNTTKSIPGSGGTIGFNTELWKFQTKPEEVGEKTTWDLAATNPQTGKIDPGLVSRETAAALDKYGNLPEEFKYLITDSYSIYEPQVAPTPTPTPPAGETPRKDTTPKDTTPTPTVAPITDRPGPVNRVGTPAPNAPAVRPQQPISIPKMTAL